MNDGGELSATAQGASPAGSEPGTLTRINAVSLTAYSGPLPHPEILQQYEQIYPGAAKQIFDDFILESEHRRRLERKVINADAFGKITGAGSSALIGLLGVSGGFGCCTKAAPSPASAPCSPRLAACSGFIFTSSVNRPQTPTTKPDCQVTIAS